MRLSEKIRYLREVEGSLRGMDRAMTQQEVVRAIAEEAGGTGRGRTISQSYLSQLESGARPHLTNTTRLLLAKFFKVHPGYLVDDPENFQSELRTSEVMDDKLDLWLVAGAERFGRRDADLCRALLTIAPGGFAQVLAAAGVDLEGSGAGGAADGGVAAEEFGRFRTSPNPESRRLKPRRF
jgi:transcriptional regulator with XRE-family HTH domain